MNWLICSTEQTHKKTIVPFASFLSVQKCPLAPSPGAAQTGLIRDSGAAANSRAGTRPSSLMDSSSAGQPVAARWGLGPNSRLTSCMCVITCAVTSFQVQGDREQIPVQPPETLGNDKYLLNVERMSGCM